MREREGRRSEIRRKKTRVRRQEKTQRERRRRGKRKRGAERYLIVHFSLSVYPSVPPSSSQVQYLDLFVFFPRTGRELSFIQTRRVFKKKKTIY